MQEVIRWCFKLRRYCTDGLKIQTIILCLSKARRTADLSVPDLGDSEVGPSPKGPRAQCHSLGQPTVAVDDG